MSPCRKLGQVCLGYLSKTLVRTHTTSRAFRQNCLSALIQDYDSDLVLYIKLKSINKSSRVLVLASLLFSSSNLLVAFTMTDLPSSQANPTNGVSYHWKVIASRTSWSSSTNQQTALTGSNCTSRRASAPSSLGLSNTVNALGTSHCPPNASSRVRAAVLRTHCHDDKNKKTKLRQDKKERVCALLLGWPKRERIHHDIAQYERLGKRAAAGDRSRTTEMVHARAKDSLQHDRSQPNHLIHEHDDQMRIRAVMNHELIQDKPTESLRCSTGGELYLESITDKNRSAMDCNTEIVLLVCMSIMFCTLARSCLFFLLRATWRLFWR